MTRIINGSLYKTKSGAATKLYVRYRLTEVRDGQPAHVWKSEFLHDEDGEHYFRAYTVKGQRKRRHTISPKLESLRREVMARVNSAQLSPVVLRTDRLISEYWRDRFIPWLEEVLPITGKSRSPKKTRQGHRQIYRQFLEAHFAGHTLRGYTQRHADQFLKTLAKSHAKTVLKHVRTTAAALFNLAKDDEVVAVNPWHGLKLPKDALERDPRKHYTVEESENLISALAGHADCQLMLSLCCFLGLRPGEMAGLRWEDVDATTINIRRAAVAGEIGDVKSHSQRAVPLIPQVAVPLSLWADECGNPTAGFIFEKTFGAKLDYSNTIERVIIPHVKGGTCVRCKSVQPASGVTWKSLYGGRHGAATAAIELTGGNYAAGAALLGHKDESITLRVYKHRISDKAFTAAMAQYAAALPQPKVPVPVPPQLEEKSKP